ncbi:hypothetical protein BD414DRAFT_161639 [Trametes punicea]|nr:hypothetical protein BD414DRAFT_161639 [Trametes punicea]
MTESDVLIEYAKTSHRQSMHMLASAVWLLYDLLTTFDQEVEFVWRSTNTFPKLLYFISRYGGLCGQLYHATAHLPIFCRGDVVGSLVVLGCMMISVELSLMLRIDALYGRSRKVRLLLFAGFAAELGTVAGMNTMLYSHILGDLQTFPPDWPVRGCVFPDSIFINKLVWIPVLAFETLLFCLNTIKCISYGPLDHHTPLIYRLFRDGSVYFAITLAFMLLCTASQFMNDSQLSIISVAWISAVFSCSGCHLLLSVRSVAARREQLDLTLFSVHASDMDDNAEPDCPMDGRRPLSPDEPPRLSLPHRANSIELVPRHRSLIVPSGKSTDEPETHSSDSSRGRRSETLSPSCSSSSWLASWKV